MQIGTEYDSICKIPHDLWHEIHHVITKVEFEYFGSFGVALFYICHTGAYLSVANLNLKTRTIQVDFGNRILVDARRGFCRIQLLKIDDRTGIAMTNHGRGGCDALGHTFETFRLTDAGKLNLLQFTKKLCSGEIQILFTRYVPHGVVYRVAPLILHTHLYYFTALGTLTDYDYTTGTYKFEFWSIPKLKSGYPGAWYEKKFYFLYYVGYEQYKFGVFDMSTKRYSLLHLPENIPLVWMNR